MWASVDTDRRFFVLNIFYKNQVGALLWSVDSKKIERILDEDILPKKNVEVLRFIMNSINEYKTEWRAWDFKWGYRSYISNYVPDPHRKNSDFSISWSDELHCKDVKEVGYFDMSPYVKKAESTIPY